MFGDGPEKMDLHMNFTKLSALSLAMCLAAACAAGQATSLAKANQQASQPLANCDDKVRSTYLLGPDDQLEISGPELTEFGNKPVRIDSDGNVQVPMVGRVHVAGITVQQ